MKSCIKIANMVKGTKQLNKSTVCAFAMDVAETKF